MKKNDGIPKYRRQKRKSGDLAFVELAGRRHYLGAHGTETSRTEYKRLVAEWLSRGRQLSPGRHEITIAELLVRYLRHAEAYYRRADGTLTNEVENLCLAMRPLRDLYGHTLAVEFGPLALKAVRQNMVEQGGSRMYINRHVERLKRIFKWAVAEELLGPSVHQALQAVPGLKRGRTTAREPDPVRPVPEPHVDAVKPHVARQVWALIQLQLLTAARSGELLVMRAIDLDTSGKIWTYSPKEHKTAHWGHERVIYLGPRAQEVLRPFLDGRPLTAYLFSPADADREHRAALHRERKTPLSCGNRPGTKAKKNRRSPLREHYTTDSYCRAITRACKKADVPKWHPHQLRHSAATHLRKEFGLEVARIILGHRSAAITEIYAELDRGKAIEVMEKIG